MTYTPHQHYVLRTLTTPLYTPMHIQYCRCTTPHTPRPPLYTYNQTLHPLNHPTHRTQPYTSLHTAVLNLTPPYTHPYATLHLLTHRRIPYSQLRLIWTSLKEACQSILQGKLLIHSQFSTLVISYVYWPEACHLNRLLVIISFD